ncbi:MAG TPA: TrkA family potassium uptake protein [Candidatus Cloacimonadota bacterium]|nr:TrkA family potassium uptake protein [Candidatus Cloacimonadota bacterium]HPT70990.1 TrkA family potassium uptake protein [Candidatus Cloacimonadota bacterium]
MKEKLYIIIVGCGRLGSAMGNHLSLKGHSIVMIDLKSDAFHKLNTEFSGFKMEGDATEFSVLQQAKIEKADILMSLTDDDNINIMVAQIAQKFFGIKKVIARIVDPLKQTIYADLGLDTISPTLITQDFLQTWITKG